MESNLETLEDAARRSGYLSPSSLRAACSRQEIVPVRWGKRVVLVDKDDVDAYVVSRQRRGGRGKRRKA